MATIGSLAVNVVANTGGLVRGMTKGRSQLKLFTGVARGAQRAILGLGTTMAAGFTIHGLAATSADMDRINKSARRLGLTTESLTGMEHAARLSGVATSELAKGLERVSIQLSDARRGDLPAIEAFGRLGITIRQLDGMGADRVLGVIADKMNALPDAAARAGAAAELLGRRSGPRLVSLLEIGSKGLAAMQTDAEKLGITFNAVDGKNIESANDALTRTGEAIKGLARQIVVNLAPAIKQATDAMTTSVTGTNEAFTAAAGAKIGKMSDADFKAFSKRFRTAAGSGASTGQGLLQAASSIGFSANDIGTGWSLQGIEEAIQNRWDELSKTAQQGTQKREGFRNLPGRILGGGIEGALGGLGSGADRLGQFFDTVETGVLDLQKAGVKFQLIDAPRNLQKAADEQRRIFRENNEALGMEASALFRSVMTDAEQAQASIARAMDLFKDGLVGEDTIQRMITQWDDRLQSASTKRHLGFAEMGSREAFDATRNRKEPISEVAKNSREMLKVLKDIRDGKAKPIPGALGDINVTMHAIA